MTQHQTAMKSKIFPRFLGIHFIKNQAVEYIRSKASVKTFRIWTWIRSESLVQVEICDSEYEKKTPFQNKDYDLNLET